MAEQRQAKQLRSAIKNASSVLEGLYERYRADFTPITTNNVNYGTLNNDQRVRATNLYNLFIPQYREIMATQERMPEYRNNRRWSAQTRAVLRDHLERLTALMRRGRTNLTEMRKAVSALGRQSRRERANLPSPPRPTMTGRRQPEFERQANRGFNLLTYTTTNVPIIYTDQTREDRRGRDREVRIIDVKALADTAERLLKAVVMVLPRLEAGEEYYIAFDGTANITKDGEPRDTPLGFNRNTFRNLDRAPDRTQETGLFLRPMDLISENPTKRIKAFCKAWAEAMIQMIDNLIDGDNVSAREHLYELGDTFETFSIVAKKLLPEGQGYIELRDDLQGRLWSPKTHGTCLIDCLRYGLRQCGVAHNEFPHYSTIFKHIQEMTSKQKDINRNLESFLNRPLQPKEIKYILKAVGLEKSDYPQVRVYKLFEETNEFQRIFELREKDERPTTPNHPTIYLILYRGHYVWWAGFKAHPEFKEQLHERLFEVCEEAKPMNPEAKPLIQEDIQPPSLYGWLLPHTYFFDYETCPNASGKAMVYWAGWTKMANHFDFSWPSEAPILPKAPNGLFDPTAVRREEDITNYYGFDAMKHFLCELKNIALERRNKFMVELHRVYKERYGEMINATDEDYDNDKNIFPKFKDERMTLLADKLVRKFRAVFWGYNNARFDNYLTIGHGGSALCDKRLIDAHGIIEYQMFGGLVVFKDLYRHLAPASLAKACKDFGIPSHLTKGEAPHDFMREDTLYYKGAVPDTKYWKGGKIPFDLLLEDEWDAEAYIRKYAKRDVFATMLVAVAYYDAMNHIVGGNALSKLTMPSVAWSVFGGELMNEDKKTSAVKVIKSVEVDRFIRSAIVGGRSVVSKSYFKTEATALWKEMVETFTPIPEWEMRLKDLNEMMEGRSDKELNRHIKDAFKALLAENPSLEREVERRTALMERFRATKAWLADQDANSLYASAMAMYEYPCEEAEWVSEHEFNRLMTSLNHSNYEHIGIVECDITYPNKEGVFFPVMAIRTDNVNKYTLEDQRVIRHTTDLMEACKYNKAKVVKVYRALIWRKKKALFKEVIERLYEQRNRYKAEEKDALQNSIKLLCNAGYGKLIQRIIDTEKRFYRPDELVELDAVFKQGKYLSHTDFGERLLVEQICEVKDEDITMPSYLGVSVLAYSRQLMNRQIEAIGGFDDLAMTCFYMDTDSAFIMAEAEERMASSGLIGKNLGQFKSDLKGVEGGMIGEGIFIAPKLYYLKYVGMTEYGLPVVLEQKRSKGTTTKTMRREDYLTMLEGAPIVVANQRQMKRCLDGTQGTGIYDVVMDKRLNDEAWSGKVAYTHDLYHHIWLPHASLCA